MNGSIRFTDEVINLENEHSDDSEEEEISNIANIKTPILDAEWRAQSRPTRAKSLF